MSDYRYNEETRGQVVAEFWRAANEVEPENIERVVEHNPAGPGSLDLYALYSALWVHQQRVVDQALQKLLSKLYAGSDLLPYVPSRRFVDGKIVVDPPAPLTLDRIRAGIVRFQQMEKPCDCVLASTPEMGPHTQREHVDESCHGNLSTGDLCGGCYDCLCAQSAYYEAMRVEAERPVEEEASKDDPFSG